MKSVGDREMSALQAGTKNEPKIKQHLAAFLQEHGVIVASTRDYGFIRVMKMHSETRRMERS